MHAGLAQVDRILKAKGNMTIDSRRYPPSAASCGWS
jgi:hypothetical protein